MITITPNLITATGSDFRTENKKHLDAINSLMDGRLTEDVINYTIAGRSISKMLPKDLLDLKVFYESRVNEEVRIERKQSRNLKYIYKDLYEPAILNQKRIL